jgi:hypothetical protein
MKKLVLLLFASLFSANISFTCWFNDNGIHYAFFDTEEKTENKKTVL